MGTFAETALLQQSLITFYRQPRETNFHFLFSLAANKWKFAVSIFHLQQTNGSCRFPLVLFSV
jgi:hypothetical protein